MDLRAGIYLLDKPAGISSAKAIAILKRKLGVKKIGHAGTLDPMATGLLVCLVNSATKFASYAEAGTKEYSGHFLFGTTTDTDDIEGNIVATSPIIPSFSEISEKIKNFCGEILQVPPQVSAIKQNGVPAYKKVRDGETVIIEARKVTIHSLQIEPTHDSNKVFFRISCSKGTYIRSIARDLGELLGCGGCLASLRRELSAPFSVEQAKDVENISNNDILDWWLLLPKVDKIVLEKNVAERLHNGDEIILRSVSVDFPAVDMLIYGTSESWLGILKRDLTGEWCFAANL